MEFDFDVVVVVIEGVCELVNYVWVVENDFYVGIYFWFIGDVGFIGVNYYNW